MQVGGRAPGSTTSLTLSEARFAVVDVETTGLSSRRHRVLQVAVVECRADGSITDRWVTYVRPRVRWFARLGPTHVHGIRRRDLKGAPRLAAVAAEVASRTEGRVLTAHNLGFDRAFLRAIAVKTGQPLRHDAEVCTLQLARRLDPANEWSHRLAALCSRYDIPLERAHDALADAEATARLLPRLLAETDATTIAELTALLVKRSPIDGVEDVTAEMPRPPGV